MIVMKFGGSSISTTERIQNVLEVIRSNKDRSPVIVASALGGVTDGLYQLAHDALKGKDDSLSKIQERHYDTAKELGVDGNILEEPFSELEVLLKGIALVKELTPRTLDYVMSFGERLSTRIIAAALTAKGLPAEQHDAFDLGMVTNDAFGNAHPLPQAEALIQKSFSEINTIPVITGYLGKTENGDITTLGRNGSDFTATYIGAAIGAEEVQIWSDTDGVMTADPRITKDAKPIPTLTFEEASELAYYGGKVLHPATITPAIQKKVPVRVLNTFKPDHPGTTIVSETKDTEKGARAIVHNLHNLAVTVTTPRMLMGHGFLARIFNIFAEHRIVVNMVCTSEVSISVTVDDSKDLPGAVEELRTFAEVDVEKEKAILCVVGEGLRSMSGIAADVFDALKTEKISVHMIS
ncbi:MAG: aspartate kinase, partial [Planctomycetota bacterium]|nr:aspartate kinase [Planctomycetota bacterium]